MNLFKNISLLLILAFVVPLAVSSAYAESTITVSTDKPSYVYDDRIVINGNITNYDPESYSYNTIAVTIISPLNNRTYVQYLEPSSDGYFLFEFALNDYYVNHLYESGETILKVGIGNIEDETSFSFTGLLDNVDYNRGLSFEPTIHFNLSDLFVYEDYSYNQFHEQYRYAILLDWKNNVRQNVIDVSNLSAFVKGISDNAENFSSDFKKMYPDVKQYNSDGTPNEKYLEYDFNIVYFRILYNELLGSVTDKINNGMDIEVALEHVDNDRVKSYMDSRNYGYIHESVSIPIVESIIEPEPIIEPIQDNDMMMDNDLQSDNGVLHVRVQVLENRVITLEADKTRLQSSNEALQTRINDNNSSTDDDALQARIDSLISENTRLNAELLAVNDVSNDNRYTELNQKFERLNTAYQSLADNITSLNDTVDSLRGTLLAQARVIMDQAQQLGFDVN